MSDNVYKTPDSDVAVIDHDNDQIATKGRRFATMLVDLVFYYLLAFAVGIGLAVLGNDQLLEKTNNPLFGILLMLLYYMPQEALWGRTLGKLIVGTRVVNLDGEKINIAQALGRTLCRFIPFEAFSFLGGSRPQGWHDKIPKTKVIATR